jgi:hypothetical protein
VIVLWLDSEEAAKVRDTAAKTLVGTLAGSEELQDIIEARRSMVTPLEKRFYSGKGNLLLGQANALVSAPGFKGDQKYNNAQGPITSPEKVKPNGTNGKSGLVTMDSKRKRRAEAIKNGGMIDDSHRLSLPTLAELLGHRHPTGTEEEEMPEESFQGADEQDSLHSNKYESDDDDESVESIHSDENDVSEMAPKKKAVRNENEDEGSEYSDSYSDSYSCTDSDSDSYSESRSESGDDDNDIDKTKAKAVTRKRAPVAKVQDGGKPKAKPKSNQKAKTAPKAKKAKATKKAKGMFQI